MALDYTEHTWGYGEEFTPDKLNNMEHGIKAASEAVNEVNNNLTKIGNFTNLMNEKGYYSGSLNDLKTTGLYYAYESTDYPESKDAFGLVVVFSLSVVFQIYVGYFGYPCIRTFNHVAGEWSEWKDL